MKKIIALVVAIVMMAAIAVPAFAAQETITGGTAPANANQTLLSYGVDQNYVVTIPASLDLSEETAVELSVAAGYAIPYNTTLSVTVASANGWKLKDAVTAENTASITYDIVDGEGNSLQTEAVLEAPANAASTMVESSFDVELGTIPSIVATYTDYLTFTVTIA